MIDEVHHRSVGQIPSEVMPLVAEIGREEYSHLVTNIDSVGVIVRNYDGKMWYIRKPPLINVGPTHASIFRKKDVRSTKSGH